jgi:hypothetical protein
MQLEATERHAFWARFYRTHLVPSLNHSGWLYTRNKTGE